LRKTNFNTQDALQALIQGKEEGVDYFFGEYYTPLCFFASSLVNDNCLAEEITSEAFIKLWERRESLAMAGSIKSWLYSTVRNACIDHLRKVKRLRVNEQGLQTTNTIEQSVLHTIVETETVQQIVHTIDRLPPQCGRIFKLFYLYGKSYKEIAKELNLSPQTVRNQKQRAAKLIKKMITPLALLVFLLN
jgi:RNA polymerase sigma-70 factor (family 1)